MRAYSIAEPSHLDKELGKNFLLAFKHFPILILTSCPSSNPHTSTGLGNCNPPPYPRTKQYTPYY